MTSLKILKNIVSKLSLVIPILFFDGCRPYQNQGGNCSPNVVEEGMQIQVSALSSEAYVFKLCQDTLDQSSTYSVYGSYDPLNLKNPKINLTATVRKAIISGATKEGQGFQVKFLTTDKFFAIYRDEIVDGTPTIAATNQIVSPHNLPQKTIE